MELISLEKKYEGRFLSYYVATYLNKENQKKGYEFISRNKNLTKETFGSHAPEGVEMVTFSEDRTKVLMNREFRLSCNKWIYNFPAGLIDPGEDGLTAAKRELKEETGLDVKEILGVLNNNYSAHGICDEIMCVVIMTCSGEIVNSTFADEEIEAKWFTKAEIRKMLEDGEAMSTRAAMLLYMWINEK